MNHPIPSQEPNPAAPDSLDALRFDNRFVQELPGDPKTSNHTRQVHEACYSRVEPTPVAAPKLVAYSREVAEFLDIDEKDIATQKFADIFAGNRILEGMAPYAACYGGHQFGNWAGQLGDGRAITLGEVLNRKGERWELQLKGAGPTPYSRRADGRAVMRSSVREFLCSEAMYHLGVPTTRALSLVATGDQVVRDMFYNGNARPEPGAIVCRVAPTFLRFGNFEIFSARDDLDNLKTLMNFTIQRDFPHLLREGEPISKQTYLDWFSEICRTTAIMLAHWMRVGFVHGVMNTDNMSILGLTIDYGPYGWVDDFDPSWTPNTTDAAGRRYCFGNQPDIGLWNLLRLANAIYPTIESAKDLEDTLDVYIETLKERLNVMMAQKLGLEAFLPEIDHELVRDLNAVLQRVETDMTLFYRHLADLPVVGVNPETTSDQALMEPLMAAYYAPETHHPADIEAIGAWLRRYIQRIQRDQTPDATRKAQMNTANPKYVMRNYLAQLAIDKAEQGDPSGVIELLDVMRHPYDEQPGKEEFAQKRPEWARHKPGCSMLSCSS